MAIEWRSFEDKGTYVIHQVEREDLNEGWIWVRSERLKTKIENRRPVVRVRDTRSGKKVCCEALYADDAYMRNRRHQLPENAWNNTVFLSGWYRRRLAIEDSVGEKRELEIKQTKRLWTIVWQLRACASHPQIAVVMSTVLAIVGTGLGIVGAATVLKDARWVKEYAWEALALLGVVTTLLGVAPLVSRARS